MATMATPAGPVAKVLAFCVARGMRKTNKKCVRAQKFFVCLRKALTNCKKLYPVRDVKSEH